MVYSFARIGAALGMAVEDVYTQNRRVWVRLREKGGKRHAMPCHHNLEEYLTDYLDGAGLRSDPKGPLFRTIGRGTGKLTRTVLPQANAYAMIGRRATTAGIATKLGNHSFRAMGITAYLKNGGTLEKAQPHVEFVGEITDAEKSEFLGNAAGLVFPIAWREPFGLAMVEAMACGTPVVAMREWLGAGGRRRRGHWLGGSSGGEAATLAGGLSARQGAGHDYAPSPSA
jgi:hypothetical protein